MGYSTTVFPTTKLKDLGNYTRTVASLRSWIIRSRLKMVFSWMPKAHLYVAPAAILLPIRTLWFPARSLVERHHGRLTTMLPANAILCCSETSKRAQDQLFQSDAAKCAIQASVFQSASKFPRQTLAGVSDCLKIFRSWEWLRAGTLEGITHFS